MNTKEFADAVNAHLDTMESEGGKKEGAPEVKTITQNKTQDDYNLDVKDILTNFVGKGNDIRGDDRSAQFSRLKVLVGEQKAIKLLDHISLFNQRDDVKNKKPEEKVESFYNTISNDKDVSNVIDKVKNLGGSPLYSMRNEPDVINKELSGKDLGKESKIDQTTQIAKAAAKSTQ